MSIMLSIFSLFVSIQVLAVPISPILPNFRTLLSHNNNNYIIDDIYASNRQDRPEVIFQGTAANINQIWSGSYWPSAFGGPSYRYLDASFPALTDTNGNYNLTNSSYYQIINQLGMSNRESANQQRQSMIDSHWIDFLSPTEKYDLLVGDLDFTLSNVINGAHNPAYTQRNIGSWEGLCHGWAVASMAEPGATKTITVMGKKGHRITFYPSDIRALTTLLYANSGLESTTNMVGQRCNLDEKQLRNKRLNHALRKQHPECFDTNPADFHLALINKVGLEKKPFIVDTTESSQVWNHPVVAYDLEYSQPKKNKFSVDLQSAILSASESRNFKLKDVFGGLPQFWRFITQRNLKNYRSSEQAYQVSVKVMLWILTETQPFVPNVDSSNQFYLPTNLPEDHNAAYKVLEFKYDLELDKDYKIIGGEWLSDSHPDFIWGYNDRPAMTYEDQFIKASSTSLASVLKQVDTQVYVNDLPMTLYQSASQRQAPLAKVVRALIQQAK